MDRVWLTSSLFFSLWILFPNDPRSWRNSRLLRHPSFLSNNGSILKKLDKEKSPSCAQGGSGRIPVLCPLHPCCRLAGPQEPRSRGKRYNFQNPSHLAEAIKARVPSHTAPRRMFSVRCGYVGAGT
ncbi:hypothetical protein BDP81DRAFT_420916 [Colletotrichum phormii]|uniref:Secreted protein n=1 Tax=Colletotrichum phormii TaxID=359342 RepID=A0AAI9ZYS0_9PEZI|nr:uncharacterized protein BDP81DRAFT_420916 [Colletotrichum phormii]KAK1639408.1 hypothetical protein BDP81DRAFT_420916 [Colletotrichum phormii]